MRTLVIYDSAYGNTAKIARAVEKTFARLSDTQIYLVSEAKDITLADIDLLVVGSPTQGGRATQVIQDYINTMPQLAGLKVAVFDTRYAKEGHGIGLRLLMTTIGFAASKMAASLTAKGGELASYPEGFIVTGREGPLKDGEVERARQWARELIESL